MVYLVSTNINIQPEKVNFPNPSKFLGNNDSHYDSISDEFSSPQTIFLVSREYFSSKYLDLEFVWLKNIFTWGILLYLIVTCVLFLVVKTFHALQISHLINRIFN